MSLRTLDRFARAIDRFNARVGDISNWLYPILMLVIIVNVVSRYGFNRGFIEFEEIQWHLYSMAFLLCMAWTYGRNEHVRVDIFYGNWSPRRKAWVELIGCLVLLLPFTISVLWFSIPYFLQSVQFNERSEMPGGLPARYIIKGFLSFGLLLLTAQGISVAIQNALFLLGYQRERE
jgi:TRAP-type mannitol/chloroaromatic compound transport system permease small subunit